MHIAAVVLALLFLSGPVFSSPTEMNQKLYEAVNSFDSAAVSSLIEKGADPNSVYVTGYTPLMRAVEIKQLEIVRQLLKSGANPNLHDGNGRSTAEIAIEANSVEIIEALLEGGADFNVKDTYSNSMVLRTVGSGSEFMYEIVATFGRYGVNMNLGTASQTPLYHAVQQNDTRMVKVLLEAGADPSLATETGGFPLGSALSHPEALDLLLKAGADPNGVDRYGDPVLFQALFSVSTEAAEVLIAAGADVNRPGADGRTPLTRARDGGAEAVVELLERHGATDGKQEETQGKPAKQAKVPVESVPTGEEYPRMADLPVYPGAETMYMLDETHSANFISPDPLSMVAKVTEELLEKAGWQEAKNSHVKRETDRNYVMFGRGKFLLITDIGIARAMGNKTAISYLIIPKE